MRNLLALLGLAIVVFLGLGYYLGWYKFNLGADRGGKRDIHLQVDTDKIEKDAKEGLGKIEGAGADAADNLKKNPSENPVPSKQVGTGWFSAPK